MSSRNGETGTPRACSWSCSEIAPPNRSAPPTARSGCHLAKITSATAMNPRPAVIHSAHVLARPSERCAPAIPPRSPATNSAWYCSRCGLRAGRERGDGVLADRAQAQPPARREEHPPDQHGDGHRGVDQRVVLEQRGPSDRQLRRATGSRSSGRPGDLAADVRTADQRAQPDAAEHEGEAAGELVRPPRDDEEREDQVEERRPRAPPPRRRAPRCPCAPGRRSPSTAPISITPSRPRFTTPARSLDQLGQGRVEQRRAGEDRAREEAAHRRRSARAPRDGPSTTNSMTAIRMFDDRARAAPGSSAGCRRRR